MTPKQAAKIFKREKAEQEMRAPQLKEAKRVLVEHFESTKTNKFEGVGFAVDTRNNLDTDRVRAFLGERIAEFTKQTTSRTLSVLEEP